MCLYSSLSLIVSKYIITASSRGKVYVSNISCFISVNICTSLFKVGHALSRAWGGGGMALRIQGENWFIIKCELLAIQPSDQTE